jgi:hypothetical protein
MVVDTLSLSFRFANVVIVVIVIGFFVVSGLRLLVGQAAGIPWTWDSTGWLFCFGLVVSIFAMAMSTMSIIAPGRLRRFRHLFLHFLNPAVRLYSRSHFYSLVDGVSCYDCYCIGL